MTCQTDYFETTTTITLRNHGGSLLPRLYECLKREGNSVARRLEGRVCKLSGSL
jgi:hypothetical protein